MDAETKNIKTLRGLKQILHAAENLRDSGLTDTSHLLFQIANRMRYGSAYVLSSHVSAFESECERELDLPNPGIVTPQTNLLTGQIAD